MAKAPFFVALLTCSLSAQPLINGFRLEPSREPHMTYSLANKQMPKWSGGALVLVENNGGTPAFYAFDGEGRTVFSSTFSVPESSRNYVLGYARGQDGLVALCGSSWTSDARGAPYIAWISADGVQSQILRVAPYTPTRITVAPDGTIWAVGRELINGKESVPGVDMDGYVIRQFDRQGKLLNGYIRRSEIGDRMRFAAINNYLVSSGGRVGWYSYGEDFRGEYIEVSNGVVTHFSLPDLQHQPPHWLAAGVAMTDAGEVFVALGPLRSPPRQHVIYTLDRAAGAWRPLVQPPALNSPLGLRLFGAEGNELVFWVPEPARLQFFRIAR